MALGVLGQQAARVGERALLADAGEDVEQRAPRRARVAHAVRGDGVEAERVGEVEQRLVRGLLRAAAVALDVDDDAARPEGLDEPRQPFGVGRARPSVSTPGRATSPSTFSASASSKRERGPRPWARRPSSRVISRQRFR